MPKLYLCYSKVKILFFVFIFSFLYTNTLHAQCAGTDAAVDVCDKELDSNNQMYDLFDALGGTPDLTGTWISNDPVNNGALTGNFLDLWDIRRFGEHTFTYTNPLCGESATVTINLGGYPGEDNVLGGANACSDDTAVNMFTFLDNESLSIAADINGLWEETTPVNPSGALYDNYYFDASIAGSGIYTFTYTVSEVGSCVSEFATVVLEVHDAPNPGIPTPINLCESEDMSPYANVNLHDQLAGEDSNGIWTDDSGTGQLTDIFDTTINVEEIYNNFGHGEYTITYRVYPSHGVCSERFSTVVIFIEEEFTLSGTANIENTCVNSGLTMNFSYDVDLLPNNLYSDLYSVTYELYDENDVLLNTVSFDEVTIRNGNFTLPVSSFSESGLYSAAITNIVNNELTEHCDIQLDTSPESFIIYDPEITSENIC